MRSWFHARWERRADLLVAGVLSEADREATLRHARTCAVCAEQIDRARRAWTLVSDDPAREARMPISVPSLMTRIHARLEEREASSVWPGRRPWIAAALVGSVLLVALVPVFVKRADRVASSPRPLTAAAEVAVEVTDEVFARMEREVARQQVARFLMEAQDVLVNVASHPHFCDKEARRLDVSAEAKRSRELLAKRALVDQGAQDAPGAQTVMQAIERTLRDVAVLEPCARPWELRAIQEDLEESRLLIKIDLVTRELMG